MVATYMPLLLRRHGMYIVPRYCALPQSCLSIQSLFQMEDFRLIHLGKDYFFLFRDWASLYSFKIQFFSSEVIFESTQPKTLVKLKVVIGA